MMVYNRISSLPFFTALLFFGLTLFISPEIVAQDTHEIEELKAKLSAPKDTAYVTTLLDLSKMLRWSDREASLQYVQEAITLAKQLDFKRGLLSGYNKLGITYWAQSDYPKAIHFFNQSYQISSVHNPCFAFVTLRNIAMCHLSLEQPDSALTSLRKILDRPKDCETTGNNHNGIVEFYAGQAYSKKKQYDSAQWYFNQARLKAENQGFNNLKAATYRETGIIHKEKGEYVKALENLFAASKEFASDEDSVQLEKCYYEIGNIYSQLDRDSLSASFYHRALSLAHALSQHHSRFLIYNQLAQLYQKKGAFDSTLHYYNQGLALADSSDKVSQEAFQVLLGMSRTHRKLGHIDTAIVLAARGYRKAVEAKAPRGIVEALICFSQALESKSWTQALVKAKEAYQESNRNQWPDLRRDAAMQLYRLYEVDNDPLLALHYFKIYSSIRDSLQDIEVRLKGEALNKDFIIDARGRELNNIRLELEEEVRKSEFSSTVKYFLIVLILLILAFGIVVFLLARQKNKSEKAALELQQNLNQQDHLHLEKELEFKRRELTTFTLQMSQKNEVLEELKSNIDMLAQNPMVEGAQLKKISKMIGLHLQSKNDWESFKYYFNQVQSGFLDKLKHIYPELSRNEVRLCALLHIKLPNDEISQILNIQPESLRKAVYRMRQKMKLNQGQDLGEVLNSLV